MSTENCIVVDKPLIVCNCILGEGGSFTLPSLPASLSPLWLAQLDVLVLRLVRHRSDTTLFL